MSQPTKPSETLAADVYRIPFVDQAGEIPAREIVGSKAHNLMRVARCGLDVPAGFVFGTGLSRDYQARGKRALADIDRILRRELEHVGAAAGRHFGDAKRPLLVSVRSGAAVSMPGMMETILNVGLNAETGRGLTRMTGNPRLAPDCRRRLIQQFAEVVHDVPPAVFDKALAAVLAERGRAGIEDLDTSELHRLVEVFLDVFEQAAGRPFPDDPFDQLKTAVAAVLRSWSSPRARTYRRINAIPDDLGTATLVQAMVFGNTGPRSGSGVCFTRSPADGGNHPYVDFLRDAQGEDVVSGRRRAEGLAAMERHAPAAHRALLDLRGILEREFGDMQDFEFTIESGRLYLLQSRAGKRSPLAALRIAHDLVVEGLIAPAEGLARLQGIDLDAIETVRLRPPADARPLGRGVPASSGVTSGMAVFDPGRVAALRGQKPLILLRPTVETGDIQALAAVDALITAEGARTSHAAVVARQLDKTCVVGCAALSIDSSGRGGAFGAERVAEGESLSVDGATGEIFRGEIPAVRERPEQLLAAVGAWRKTGTDAAAKSRGPDPVLQQSGA